MVQGLTNKLIRGSVVPLGLLMCCVFWPFGSAFAQMENGADSSESAGGDFDAFSEEFGEQTTESEKRDPLEPYNRVMYNVNDTLYVWVLKPAARVYSIIPENVREGVDHAFKNVKYPIYVTNNMLQGDFEDAGINTIRFCMNTTMGLGGMFDAAARCFDLRSEREDFGQTMGRWGLRPGIPLVLPAVGMSTVVDALGRIPDDYLNPVSYVDGRVFTMTRAVEKLNLLSLNWKVYDRLKEEALDEYTYLRDLYLQNREEKIQE